jgi:hypothetical protein
MIETDIIAKKKPKDDDGKCYNWQLTPNGVNCFASKERKCWVSIIQNATVLSDFHDERLERATEQINAILQNVQESNKDRCLSILHTPRGLFLAWTRKAFGPSDQDTYELCKRLGI